MDLSSASGNRLTPERAIVALFVLFKLALCLFPFEYGFFRDELYYIALSDNPDFGYVDVPPAVPFLLAIVRPLIGTSFFSLHLLPAVSGALVVWLVSLMVKEMGGRLGAQFLALTCVTLAPIYLCWESTYTYDAFDKLIWVSTLYVVVLLLKTHETKYWLLFGIVVGFGLLTKITILFLVFGILAALAITRERKFYLGWQIWAGAVIALLIATPYLLWQIKEGLPALEYYKNYASAKTWPTTPLEFVKNQILTMNVLAFPVWSCGIYYFLFHRNGRKFRVLGLGYIVVLVVCIILEVKFYLLAPYYTVLFAGGAVLIEEFTEKHKIRRLRRISTTAILLVGLVHVPFARPVVPIEPFVKYTGRSVWEGIKAERVDLGRLPQHFADRFGWEEMAETISIVYNTLSEEEKSKACVLTGNYGEAGAVWVYREKYGLPKPISGHLQFYLWGPRGYSGEVVISLGIQANKLENHFNEVEKVGGLSCRWAISHEKYLDIYLCRGPRKPLEDMWPSFKHLD